MKIEINVTGLERIAGAIELLANSIAKSGNEMVPVSANVDKVAKEAIEEAKKAEKDALVEAIEKGADGAEPEIADKNAWYQHEDGSVFKVSKGDEVPDYVKVSKKITRDKFNEIHEARKAGKKEEPKPEPEEVDDFEDGLDFDEETETPFDFVSPEDFEKLIRAVGDFDKKYAAGLLKNVKKKLSEVKEKENEELRQELFDKLKADHPKIYKKVIG